MSNTNTQPEAEQPTPNTEKQHNHTQTTPNNGDKYAHLRKHQWGKGQSGNPKGRPKRTEVLTDLLWKELNRKDKLKGVKNIDLVIKAIVEQAKKGKSEALKLLVERLWGKTPDSITVSGQMGHATVDINALLEATKGNPEDGRQLASAIRRSLTDSTGA